MKRRYDVIVSSVGLELAYDEFDDVANVIGYIIEGRKEHAVGFVIRENDIKEEE